MFGWLIVMIVMVLLSVACWIVARRADFDAETGWQIGGFVSGLLAFIFIIMLIFAPPSVKVQIGKFDSQKSYIESHTSKNPLEDATITNTKIEMNAWLFGAQQSQKVYGIFSFYPDEIQALEPIQ